MLPQWPMEKSIYLAKRNTILNEHLSFSNLYFFFLFSSNQQSDLQQLNAQMMTAQQKSQQFIENNNNNQPLMDPSQKRRLSRSQENSLIEKPSLPLDNHTKSTNESHYIKNKTLQSPVNRYKVNFLFSKHFKLNKMFVY